MTRLDKLVSMGSGLSRTEAKKAIRQGRVTVCGRKVSDPDMKVGEQAGIGLDGAALKVPEYVYIMMDKPEGVLSATEDKSQQTVLDLLPEIYKKRDLGVAGRLDKDTTGLLLITDDGSLNHRLTSPKSKAGKLYKAYLDMPADQGDKEAFACGMQLSDFIAAPAVLEINESDPRECLVTISEGKYHQIKRMFAKRGKTVVSLRRLACAGLYMDPELGSGGFRELTDEEIAGLFDKCGLKATKKISKNC